MEYVVCAKLTKRREKGSSQMWVDGTESIRQDSLERRINGEPQQLVEGLAWKKIASWNDCF